MKHIKKIIVFSVLTVGFISAVLYLLFTGPGMDHQPSLRAYESIHRGIPEDIVSYNSKDSINIFSTYPQGSEENLYAGRVYYEYYCIACHGIDGKGNGPVGQSFMPKPSDLTHDSIKNQPIDVLYQQCFSGTGHSPVLNRIVPDKHKSFLVLFLKESSFQPLTNHQ
jgi:hypothetical protein